MRTPPGVRPAAVPESGVAPFTDGETEADSSRSEGPTAPGSQAGTQPGSRATAVATRPLEGTRELTLRGADSL